MRWLGVACVLMSVPAMAQDAVSVGRAAVGAVLGSYAENPLALVPQTQKPLPAGKWGMRGGRPESCPHDETPCVRVVYAVPESRVMCEWTVVPRPDGTAVFADQNEDASRYFVRELRAAEVAPLVVTSEQPIYPPIARAAHVFGPVVVRVVVSEKGTVTVASAVNGPELLRASAAEAAKKWTFQPLSVGTRAVPFTVDLNATFALKEDPSNCTKTGSGAYVCGKVPDGGASMRP